MYLEPAHSIITLLGGSSVVSRHLGVAASGPHRWRKEAGRFGTGGYIPTKYHDRLIALAAEQGKELPRAAFVDAKLAQELLRRHRESETPDAAA